MFDYFRNKVINNLRRHLLASLHCSKLEGTLRKKKHVLSIYQTCSTSLTCLLESLDVNREAFLDAGHVEDELGARGAVSAAGEAVVGAVVRPRHVADEQLRHSQPRLRGGGAHAGPGNHGRDIRHGRWRMLEGGFIGFLKMFFRRHQTLLLLHLNDDIFCHNIIK